MLTFYVIEYDSGAKWSLELFAKLNKKNFLKEDLDQEVSAKLKTSFDDPGQICGYGYLDYYENPEQELIFPNYGFKMVVGQSDN